MAENYLIIGENRLIRDREIQNIKKKFVPPEFLSYNYSEHLPQDIVSFMVSLGTVPFLSKKRVVLLKEGEALSDGDIESVISYLEKPFDASVMVIAAGEGLKKAKRFNDLLKLMVRVDASEPAEADLKNWIRAFLKKEGVNISPEAVELLFALKGKDSAALKQEIEKLISYSGQDPIGTADVEKLVGRSVADSVFVLVDALNKGDHKWAFRILGDLYGQRKNETEIIGYLNWYARLIGKIKYLSVKGLDVNAIAREVGYSPAYVARFRNEAKRFSGARLKRWNAILLNSDRDIKSGLREPALVMDMLIPALIS